MWYNQKYTAPAGMAGNAELQEVQPLRIAVLLAVYFAGIENDDIDENAGLIFGNAFKRAANAVRRELDVQQKRHNEFARSMKNGK